MEELTALVSSINSVLWGPYCLIPLLVGAGLYFSVRLKFVQVRRFARACKFFLTPDSMSGEKASASKGMSSFQSLATAVAAQVGTGSLAGVATALAMGGPGAIFWMWIAAFFGMATIFVEAVLAQLYKSTDFREQVTGGPAFYIANGLKSKPLAVFFAVTIILALGLIGNMVQANSIADAFRTAFGLPVGAVGVAVAFLSGFIFIGGIRRIASTTEKMVPMMAIMYLIGGAFVLVLHYDNVIPAFKMIFVGAFDPVAATGGAIGATVQEAIRYGVARGLFSNEAGMGSTPHAHAIARVKYPAEQGFVAIIGVFVTTFVVVTMTAMVILTTGVLDGKTTGILLTQRAFETGLGEVGLMFVAVCLFFFAFSTIIGWYFFAEQNVKYLFGARGVLPYRFLVVCFVFCGSLLHVDLVWELADLFNGLMVLPNLIALVALCGLVVKALKVYEDSLEGRMK
ncbi:MAG: sodium:alanine symporter family protein [Duodenibacillus sp.]|nr:sodium:alanine symporter family protein [Duodenibacillus sp.]